MFKCLFRLAILAVIGLAGLYFVGAYQVLHTQQGIHILKKESWTLSEFYVNTKDWNFVDWAKNPRISKAMARLELDKLRQYAKDAKAKFQSKLEAFREDSDLDWSREELKERWTEIKGKAKQGYERLDRQLDSGEISWEDFTREAERLERRLEDEIERLKKKWDER